MVKYVFVLMLALCARNRLIAQSHRWIVIDSLTEQPLSGATARTLHGALHFQTNKEGEFHLPIMDAVDTLLISYVGFKPRYIATRSIVKNVEFIRMTPIRIDLQDVSVSTGYQTISKERMTGSFYKISNNTLNQRVSSNILDRMENLAPGVLYDKRSTGNPYRIQIRGLSTITQAIAQPLIIVNNFPFTGDINSINPDDVKDITILKDAAAASIWGAKAGNGVIVITLKKPLATGKAKISFNTSFSLTSKPDLYRANQMSPSDYIDVENLLYKNGFYSWKFNNTSYPPVTPVVDVLYRQQQGLISAEQAKKSIDSLRDFDARSDIMKYLYRGSFEEQHNLNITGGNEHFKYLLSAGYDKILQTLAGNESKKINLRWNNDLRLTKNLNINFDVLYSQSNSSNNSPGSYKLFGSALGSTLYPYARLANPNGSPAVLDINWNRYFTDTAGGGKLLDWKLYPLEELQNNDNTSVSRQLLATLDINYALDSYLSLDIKSQYGITSMTTNDNRNVSSFYTRDLINKFTNLSSSLPEIRNPVPLGGILNYGHNEQQSYDFRGQMNYNRRWGTDHDLSVIAGTEIRQEATTQKRYTSFGYNANTLAFKDVDLVDQFPTYDDVSGNQYIPSSNQLNGYLNRFVSYYGNGSYTYKNKYTLSGSVRKDQSNLFGVDANQKGVPLWSIGGAWKVSKETFYKIHWLPYLNLRLTYGKSGNVNNSVSALATIRYINASQTSIRVPAASIANFPNPDLRWEQVNIFNVGLDFTSDNNYLSGSIEYYQKKSTDLLHSIDIDPSSGIQSLTANSASMKGNGIDITLNSNNIKGSFSWQTGLLFSYANYKVLKTNYANSLVNFTSDGENIFPEPGFNPYLIVSYKWGGLDKEGNPQGYAKGQLTTDYNMIRKDSINEQVISGSALPIYFGNLRNTFNYKGFSLVFNMSYKLGYYLRKPSLNYYNLFNYGKGDKEYADRWQKSGDEKITNVPSIIYPADQARASFYSKSNINVIKADNIRITDIYLSYNFKDIFHKNVFSSLELYGTMNNLNIILWKANKVDIDPDFPDGIKTPKIVAFGLKCGL